MTPLAECHAFTGFRIGIAEGDHKDIVLALAVCIQGGSVFTSQVRSSLIAENQEAVLLKNAVISWLTASGFSMIEPCPAPGRILQVRLGMYSEARKMAFSGW